MKTRTCTVAPVHLQSRSFGLCRKYRSPFTFGKTWTKTWTFHVLYFSSLCHQGTGGCRDGCTCPWLEADHTASSAVSRHQAPGGFDTTCCLAWVTEPVTSLWRPVPQSGLPFYSSCQTSLEIASALLLWPTSLTALRHFNGSIRKKGTFGMALTSKSSLLERGGILEFVIWS